MLVALLAHLAICLAQPEGTTPARPAPASPPPQSPTAQPAAAGVTGEAATAEELLDRLERAGNDLAALTAQVKYTRVLSGIEGQETQTRQGDLYFEAMDAGQSPTAEPRRRFAVHFDQLRLGQERRPEDRWFIFDGQWLVEKDGLARQLNKRRVVPPGEVADPLRLGEGPFPLPIGQARRDILARYRATLLDPRQDWPGDQPFPAYMADTYQLHLVAHPDRPDTGEFREVRIWYRKADLLPRLARTINTDGTSTEVLLINLKTFAAAAGTAAPDNHPIPPGVFDTSAPTGWNVHVDEFRRPVDEKQGEPGIPAGPRPDQGR
ncbi:MAG TPA: hypothetical protein VD963_03775 [Phycisphaerales bacterium]|nr:hypothetical protein [Phycisphaerales bacterium]